MSKRPRTQAAPAGMDRVKETRRLADTLMKETGAGAHAADMGRAMDALLPDLDPADPRARKRRRILDAGTTLLVRQGYRKTSMDEVARAAHVAKGTLYLYFPTKAALLAAAIADEKTRFAPRMKAMLDPALSPRERVRLFVRSVLGGMHEMPLMSRMLSGDAEITHALDELGRHMEKPAMVIQVDWVRGLLAAAVPPGTWSDARLSAAAQVLLALVYAAPTLLDARLRGTVPVDVFSQALADLLVDGLGAGDPPVPSARRKR